MTFNAGAILSFLVAFQMSFMSVYLFTHKKGNRRNNRLLAAILLMFALNMADFALRMSGLTFPLASLHLLDDCFFFLYGPLIYFYTQGVIYSDFAFKKRDILHLIPFLLVFIVFLTHVLTTGQGLQQDFAEKMVQGGLPVWVPFLSLSIYAHILFYLFLSWRSLGSYNAVLMDRYSTLHEINLDWLRFMIRTFFGITLIGMINSFVPVFHNRVFLIATVLVLLLVSFYFINRVLLKALNQPAIFSGIRKEETVKYALSNLTSEQVERYKKALLLLMQKDKLFLDPDLKSTDLAAELGISVKTLSQVINQGFKRNFFDFVNSFRCEEVKRILSGPDRKITILEAMFASGFNSKSSFNKEFKKLTGQTPSEYKRSIAR